MDSIRDTQKKYCSRAMILAIILGLCLILAGYKPVAKGLILGTLFSIVNFILMGETIPWRLGISKKKSTAISMGSILFRYSILAIPIFFGINSTDFYLPAVVIGVFLVQIVLLGEHIMLIATSSFRQ